MKQRANCLHRRIDEIERADKGRERQGRTTLRRRYFRAAVSLFAHLPHDGGHCLGIRGGKLSAPISYTGKGNFSRGTFARISDLSEDTPSTREMPPYSITLDYAYAPTPVLCAAGFSADSREGEGRARDSANQGRGLMRIMKRSLDVLIFEENGKFARFLDQKRAVLFIIPAGRYLYRSR